MAERDVTNAQLIGSSVLHAHALENEKRKNRLLELELEVLRRLSQTNQPSGNLFGGQLAVNAHKDLEAKVKKLQLENSDDMMIALSQQLGVEIHAKTELEAEIKRMKESDKLKSETEITENEALKKELKRVKDLLAAEERSKQSAFKEAENWKASYERLKAEHGEN
jgi:antitoxin component of MazEF toxin-antitoxin module